MVCRNNGMSDQWCVGPLVCRTIGVSDQWCVGPLVCRTNGVSDQCSVTIDRTLKNKPNHNQHLNVISFYYIIVTLKYINFNLMLHSL